MNTDNLPGSQVELVDGAWASPHPDGGVFWIRPARTEEIPDIHRLIALEISSAVGPVEAMARVFAKNPVALWRIEHRDTAGSVRPIGMYGFLPLNEAGVEALKAGTLDRREPDLRFIAPAGEKPAALYVWAMVARKIGRLTYPVIKRALGSLHGDAPTYAIAATSGGSKAIRDRGFSVPDNAAGSTNGLMLLPSVAMPAAKPALQVIVASQAEHLQMAAFVRGATFGAEQNCPYFEEFDGNDYCAMHLIGFVDGEPAATLRIRFFATFAKLERLAVLLRHRRTPVKDVVMRKAIEICERKGYATIYGQSQERLVAFYARFGFTPLQKNRELIFSDHRYVEIVREQQRNGDAITIDSDPYLIIRPEGRWDIPGVLERSATRPATNPHV